MWVWVQGLVACLASERERKREIEMGVFQKMACEGKGLVLSDAIGDRSQGCFDGGRLLHLLSWAACVVLTSGGSYSRDTG